MAGLMSMSHVSCRAAGACQRNSLGSAKYGNQQVRSHMYVVFITPRVYTFNSITTQIPTKRNLESCLLQLA
jgi:hypothetical protein